MLQNLGASLHIFPHRGVEGYMQGCMNMHKCIKTIL